MALKDQWHNPGREARLQMEDAAKHAQSEIDAQKRAGGDPEKSKYAQRYRVRGKLYDKIKVSVHTMDLIIGAVVALIVVAVIVGIALGN